MSSIVHKFKGPIEGYVINSLVREHWRIKATHTHEEAMQEAYIVFLRCAAKYPSVEAAHFMALFKTAWSNALHDLSNAATCVRNEVSLTKAPASADDVTERDLVADMVGETDNDGMLAVMIRQAPTEVLAVLNLFLNAPQELLDLAMSTWRSSGRNNATGERWAERMLGLKRGTEPLKKVEDYFNT